MKINLKESLNELDVLSNNRYDLYNTYLSKNPSLDTKKKLSEAIYNNRSPKEILMILNEDWDDAAWHDTADQEQVDQPDYFPDGEDEPEWEEMNSKLVRDSDGFLTDYTWYRNNRTGQNVFVFGDKDLYGPEDGYFDWECDTDMEGFEWFENYTGPGDEEDDDDWMDESLNEDWRDFCDDVQRRIIEGLKSKGLSAATLQELDVYVKPAGSGFKATIQLPRRISNGKKLTQFFYKRDADRAIEWLVDNTNIDNLIQNQQDLLKPSKVSSTKEFVKEARSSTDPDRLRELSKHNAATVRRAVAKNRKTPVDVLLDLYEDEDLTVREIIYYDQFLFIPDHLIYDRFHDDPNVLYRLASIGTDPDILRDIYNKADTTSDPYHTYWWLAKNENTPSDVFIDLAKQNNQNIDWVLSFRDNLPKSAVSILKSRYANPSDRDEAAILSRLADYEDGDIDESLNEDYNWDLYNKDRDALSKEFKSIPSKSDYRYKFALKKEKELAKKKAELTARDKGSEIVEPSFVTRLIKKELGYTKYKTATTSVRGYNKVLGGQYDTDVDVLNNNMVIYCRDRKVYEDIVRLLKDNNIEIRPNLYDNESNTTITVDLYKSLDSYKNESLNEDSEEDFKEKYWALIRKINDQAAKINSMAFFSDGEDILPAFRVKSRDKNSSAQMWNSIRNMIGTEKDLKRYSDTEFGYEESLPKFRSLLKESLNESKVFVVKTLQNYPYNGWVELMDKIDENGEGEKHRFINKKKLNDFTKELVRKGYKNYQGYPYLDEAMMKVEPSEEESLNEDLFDKPRNIADSICKYLDSKNFYNYELVDYDAYPMNTSKITFEVDGDWKHDHWRFKDLVYDWSFDNNKSIYKIESELVRDDGSDNYASDYFIYVTENEDDLNSLKSMSKLFSEEYELDVDNWQYLDVDHDYKPQKDYIADIETTDDEGPYYKLCGYSSHPSAGIDGDSFDTYEVVKAFDAKDAQEKFIDLLDDEDKEVLRYFNNDFRAFMKDRNLYIDDATKKEYDSFHGLGEEPGELSRRFEKYLKKEESLSESSSRNIISDIESKLFSIIKKYFHDDNYSHTQGIKITESNYDLLRYTARPYSNYRGTSSKLIMDDDRYAMSEFKSEVRSYLKQFGVTKIKFDTKKLKLHYGYVSGPDDFPVVCLNAIYFNDINNDLNKEK